MLDELEEIQGFHSPAAINDKPIEANGTLYSREATGTGAYFVTREAVRDLGIAKGAKVAVQGFGNVGRIAARMLFNDGYKVVAIGDIFGGIYNGDGIDMPALEDYVDKTGSVVDFPGTEQISTSDVLEVECDILLPAAVQSVITDNNADKIKAKLVMECANGPCTPEGEAKLMARGITIIPDVLTNCGSAIVCSFERTQGLTDTYWDEETVVNKLEERIVKAYKETYETVKDCKVSYRDSAWMNALIKIEKAMKARGWV
jgi:glutamate dehydrogenase/leucine dehydrogenase